MVSLLLLQLLHELQVSKQEVRDSWATWNPQRAAAKQLEEAIAAGTLTLQVIMAQLSYGVLTADKAYSS